ncbi:MAG: tRNA lysidine(34) synthetase TilS [Geobacteraceae bacterium]|nr:tRNA lysidine(34) synthetase TilS [Geobacteraceae bacterium]
MRGFFVCQSLFLSLQEGASQRHVSCTGSREAAVTIHSTLKKVAGTICRHGLFHSGDTVVVAVSGGPDSVALLDILVSLEKLNLTLIVAHLNHCLRGTDSDGDAAFVAALAHRLGLRAEIGVADVRHISRQRKLSLEEAGRAARYEWLGNIARTCGADRVALGHHADDQAETFLLRLLRGAGTTGLRAMRPLTSGLYARPLLCLTRADILSYLEERGLPFRVDASNDDKSFLRNRIRHECLPYLASYNPAIAERLNAAAEILAADEEVLESVTDRAFDRIASAEPDLITLRLPLLKEERAGVRMRLYRRAIRELKGDTAGIAACHLEQVDGLAISGRVNGSVWLPCGVWAFRCYDSLAFSPRLPHTPGEEWEIVIPHAGTYPLPGSGTLSVRPSPPPDCRSASASHRAYFNALANPLPWTVRTFRPGDRFQPFGMEGTKKVKDFFIDEKVPLSQRRRIPLLFCGETLLWICGRRIGEAGRLSPEDTDLMEVEFCPATP